MPYFMVTEEETRIITLSYLVEAETKQEAIDKQAKGEYLAESGDMDGCTQKLEIVETNDLQDEPLLKENFAEFFKEKGN